MGWKEFRAKQSENVKDAFTGEEGSLFDAIGKGALLLKETIATMNEGRRLREAAKEDKRRGDG